MGFHTHLLPLQCRSRLMFVNTKPCAFLQKPASLQSRRLVSSETVSATISHDQKRIVFRRRSGFPSNFAPLEFSDRKRRSRDGHGRVSPIAATSTESDDNAHIPHSDAARRPCLYLKGAVSSGQTIRYPGTVVVLGDVQEGGAVVADGDVVVLGRLHGDVHGGQNGDKSAVVYATQLDDACRIRIGDAVALVSTLQLAGCPGIASVQEDGTLGIRAAAQIRKLDDDKEARKSSESSSSAEKEASTPSERKALNRPAQLALFTGGYISVVGMALLIFPAPLFGALFDIRSVTVGWIRVGAILAMVFGVYYIGTAIGDLQGNSGARAFYMSTVVGRVFLFLGFCWLVAAGAAQRALLLVGAVNMLGAMSMLLALRQDFRARSSDA